MSKAGGGGVAGDFFGTPAIDGSFGGGGGGGHQSDYQVGTAGGDGVVIVRYLS